MTRRILDEVGHFAQQRRLRGQLGADAAAEPARVRFELAPDLLLALAAVEDDEVLEQPLLVVVERLDLDRAARPAAGRLEAVAVGVRPGADVLHRRTLCLLRPPDDERDDASAVEQHEPANGTGEDKVALAVLEVRVPAHLLREREVAQDAAHDVGQHVDRGLATLLHAVREVFAFRCLRALEGSDVDAVFARELLRRQRRRRGRWPGHQLLEVSLPLGDSDDARGEAPRRAVGLARRIARQSRLFETRVHVPRHLRGEPRQPACRNLLAADFDQQLPIHRY